VNLPNLTVILPKRYAIACHVTGDFLFVTNHLPLAHRISPTSLATSGTVAYTYNKLTITF